MRQKSLPILLIVVNFIGCTVIPGQHMSPFSDKSSTDMPVTENNEATLKKLNIQTIDAQLIIKLEKDLNNRSLGHNNVANNYFEYRIGSTPVTGMPPLETNNQYLVGPRDILIITVWEHPELTNPFGNAGASIGGIGASSGVGTVGGSASGGTIGTVGGTGGNVVGEDGTFFYPYVGIVKAAGRTVEDIRTEVTEKLSEYIERVQLDVRVNSYRSQRVYVVGEVNLPGIQTLKDIPLTVLEAINNAGGVNSQTADLRNVTLTRDGKTYGINLLALYEGGDITQNVLLKHGDVLNVADNQFNKIFVFGETTVGGTGSGRSRSVFMNKGRMTLTEALSEAGGVNQDTADAARIFVFRGGLNKPQIFHLDAKSPDAFLLAEHFPLEPHDVLYVDRAEGIRWNQIIAQIQPTITLLNTFNGTLNPKPLTNNR
jgi:polysaccharide export outer membrane protein